MVVVGFEELGKDRGSVGHDVAEGEDEGGGGVIFGVYLSAVENFLSISWGPVGFVETGVMTKP